jgi:hypothetical protein
MSGTPVGVGYSGYSGYVPGQGRNRRTGSNRSVGYGCLLGRVVGCGLDRGRNRGCGYAVGIGYAPDLRCNRRNRGNRTCRSGFGGGWEVAGEGVGERAVDVVALGDVSADAQRAGADAVAGQLAGEASGVEGPAVEVGPAGFLVGAEPADDVAG